MTVMQSAADGRMPAEARIVTTTTLKDRMPNVRRFVDRVLRQGADHMIVFLDDGQPAVRRMLKAHDHVTVIPTRARWWGNARPQGVSDRLRINANIANALLSSLPSVRWLIHLDCDEGLLVDRDTLLRSPEDAIVLDTLESVALLESEGPPTRFKRTASRAELALLTELGLIDEPSHRSYFRGHWQGKCALRPGLERRFRVHGVCDLDGAELEAASADGMHLLHYESCTLEDFSSRWEDYSPAQLSTRTHRESRMRLGLATYSLLNNQALTPPLRDQLLRRLYARRVADDVETLDALGLVVDVPQTTCEPLGLPEGQEAALEALVEAVRPEAKTPFNADGPPGDIRPAMARVAERVAGSHPNQAARLRAGLNRLPTLGTNDVAPVDGHLTPSRTESEARPARPS